MNNEMFQSFNKRIKLESIVKSFILGLCFGFGLGFLFAFITWFFTNRGVHWYLISIIISVIMTFVSSLLIYFYKLKPTEKGIASRIDSLGLKERMITYDSFKEDESLIAKIQREDALKNLKTVNSNMIKITVPRLFTILSFVFAILGISMIVVNALSEKGIIKRPQEIFNPDIYDADICVIEFSIEDEEFGYLLVDGNKYSEYIDEVKMGLDSVKVIAVANPGYQFMGWEDGNTNPERKEIKVEQDMLLVAIFEEVEGEDGEADDEDNGDGEGGEDKQNGQKTPTNSNSMSTQGENRYKPSNQVIDGDTPYQDVYSEYYEYVMSLLEGNDISGEYRSMLETYVRQLKAGINENEESND